MRLLHEQRKRFADTSIRTPDSSVRASRVGRSVLDLQRTAGNQAVQQLLRSAGPQQSLSVGRVDDPLEHEADRMAAHAMGGTSSPQLSDNSRPAHQSAQNPLDPATRAFFESRYGHDFSNVSIHTGPDASASARSIHAKAYTLGSDIVFRDGAYSPTSNQGRRLLAHELAHVVQQSRSSAPAPVIQRQPETQGQGQSQGGGNQVAVNTNCGDADARAAAIAIFNAQGMLNSAMDWFHYSDPVVDVQLNALLRARFGSDSAATRSAVNNRLARVAAILMEATKANVNLSCADATDAVCSKNEYYAYVRPGQGYRINFCREFFKMNPQEQLWGVLHETFHLAGALGDSYIFYFDVDTSSCFGSSAVKGSALDNADSYVSFLWCLLKPGTKIREGLDVKGQNPNPQSQNPQ